MASARYWRVVGLATYGGADLELSGLHLHDSTTRVDAAATLTCSHAPAVGALSALQDGSTATSCRFAGADVHSGGFCFVWDFGAALTVVTVRPSSADSVAYFLRSITLQSSTDGKVWATQAFLEHLVYPGARTACTLSAPPVPSQAILAVGGGGAAGSASFVDLSVNALTPAVTGAVAYSTDFPRLHPTAIKVAAGGSLKWSHASFKFAAGVNYRVSCWLYLSSASTFALTFAASEAANRLWVQVPAGGAVYYNIYGSAKTSQGSTSAPMGTWVFFEFGRSGSVHYSSIGGVVTAHTADSQDAAAIGNGAGALTAAASGAAIYTTALVVESGVPPRTADFLPPLDELGLYTPALTTAPPGASRLYGGGRVAASSPVAAYRCPSAQRVGTARDVEHGGPGTIYGTTKTKGTPANTPTKARVVLLHQRSKQPVRETWSDPVTGAFAFADIDTNQQFLTLAEDAAGNFRPVAASRLVPEVLP